MLRPLVAAAVIAVTIRGAAADEPAVVVEDPARVAEARRLADDDPSFGPVVVIERIDVIGNSSTAEKLVRRTLLFQEGETLRSGDPRFRKSRFRVLALGYFVDVQLHLTRGSQRGSVIVTVEVVERGTFTINRIYLGTSEATPIWAGLDLGDTNLFGTGVGVGAAFVWADQAEIEGARTQAAARIRVGDPSPFGWPVGFHASALWQRASEPFRVMGDASDGSPDNFRAFDYTRRGATAGVSIDLSGLSSVILDGRIEWVDADLGGVGAIDLVDGESKVVTIALGFERDTRADPILPYSGDRTAIVVEHGAWLGGDYDHLRARAQYERWFPIAGIRHVLSIHVGGGVIFGDAPRFDRFYLGDFDPLLAPRALDLVLSTRPPPDLLGAGVPRDLYGDVVGVAGVEYSYRLFRGNRRIYGGDLFLGVGLVTLRSLRGEEDSLPLDLTFNAGLKLDTEIGVFELSLGNALGRIPF
jgi:outer membrane protein assembly factor BamA